MLKSKSFVTQCGGLIGALSLLSAACGGSNDGTSPAGGDASAEAAPPSDAQSPPTTDATLSDDAAPPLSSDDAGTCGDGIVSGAEQCDDGANNGAASDGCTRACSWVCIAGDPKLGDTACADGNPCNGSETCQASHTCAPGVPLANGTSCGTGEICNAGLCAQAVCGDGVVTAPEECDDGSGNGQATDGCTQGCTFVCVSSVPARDCVSANPCVGPGTCSDTTHTCTAGTASANGTVCGGSLDGGAGDAGVDVCKGGVCVPGACGDGVVEHGEDCDLGAGNGAGTGCELNCTFSCTKSPDSCTTTDLCGGANTCVTIAGGGGQKCQLGADPPPGTACGGDAGAGSCEAGICHTTLCGNGVLDGNEQCDFGAGNNVTGSGCEPDCAFSCQTSPDSCAASNVCGANPMTCQADKGPNSTGGQKCQAATAVASCGDCASTGVCVGGTCKTSTCGDGCVDPRLKETCEPPSTATCDSSCHTIAAAACGNSILENGESCDDGNRVSLDGCDSNCQFEQDQRANSVAIQFKADTFCAHDALGSAIAGAAQSTLAGDLTASVNAGTTSIEFKFLGLTDLTGTAQTSGLQLGIFAGAPAAAPTGVTYNGASDLDWWYTTTPSTEDGGVPDSLTSATIASKLLVAKNASLGVTISIAGQPATLAISSATINANIGAVSKPLEADGGVTPGHLPSEHLDGGLESFASMNNGKLCGNISAASLATVPVPSALLPGAGITTCTNVTYTAANSLLDVLVSGCSAAGGLVPIINKTQPDQPSATPYVLSVDTSHKVNGCKQGTSTVLLPECLAAASYSSYFGFTSDRIIAK